MQLHIIPNITTFQTDLFFADLEVSPAPVILAKSAIGNSHNAKLILRSLENYLNPL
jgi:hypothetical protein